MASASNCLLWKTPFSDRSSKLSRYGSFSHLRTEKSDSTEVELGNSVVRPSQNVRRVVNRIPRASHASLNCHQKERDQTTTRPLWLYCIACDWSSIEHSHINRACTTTFTDPDSSEPPTNTIPAQSSQDGISQFRFAEKVSANASIQTPRTSNKGLTSICLRSRSPLETDHSNLLISSTPPKIALFYNLIPYSIRFFPNSGASSFLVSNAAEENQ